MYSSPRKVNGLSLFHLILLTSVHSDAGKGISSSQVAYVVNARSIDVPFDGKILSIALAVILSYIA